MNIYGFIQKYCPNMRDEFANEIDIDLSGFPCDYTIVDEDGKKIRVINVNGVDVPIRDILSMRRDEFLSSYKVEGAGEAYDNYLSTIIILEGEDAVFHIRNQMQSLKDQMEKYSNIETLDLGL